MNRGPKTAGLYPCLFYDDAAAAITFLEHAFGFVRRFMLTSDDGKVVHSELTFGEDVKTIIMVGSIQPSEGWISPKGLPGVHQMLSVWVADPDAHYARAKAAGAMIVRELKDEEYGSRGYLAKDPEGNVWNFATYRPGAYWGK